MQQTAEYTHVSEDTNLEYIFDPDKYGKRDPTLVTENYRLDPDKLLEYGRLVTGLRQQITDKSEQLQKAFEIQF